MTHIILYLSKTNSHSRRIDHMITQNALSATIFLSLLALLSPFFKHPNSGTPLLQVQPSPTLLTKDMVQTSVSQVLNMKLPLILSYQTFLPPSRSSNPQENQ
jgi:hypothetical protein